MNSIILSFLLACCTQPVTFDQVDALFSAYRSDFEEVNRNIIDCGAKAFDVGDGHSPGEDCVSGRDQAQKIEEKLGRLGVEYVNVDWRNFNGFKQVYGVTYILARDRFGGGGDAQSIVWLANPQPVSAPDYRQARYRPLSAGVKGWYFEELGTGPNRVPKKEVPPV